MSAMAAAATQGFIFALMHVNLFAFLPLWILGIILALMVEKYQSLIPAMIAHALFNGLTVLMLLLSPMLESAI